MRHDVPLETSSLTPTTSVSALPLLSDDKLRDLIQIEVENFCEDEAELTLASHFLEEALVLPLEKPFNDCKGRDELIDWGCGFFGHVGLDELASHLGVDVSQLS